MTFRFRKVIQQQMSNFSTDMEKLNCLVKKYKWKYTVKKV